MSFTLCSHLRSVCAEEGDIRLVEGDSTPEFAFGIPEIFISGIWSRFCFESVTLPTLAATVACRQLGFDGGALLTFALPDAIMDAFVPLAADAPAPSDATAAGPMFDQVCLTG